MTETWLLVAASNSKSYLAQTTLNDKKLIYRAASKWLIRGGASRLLSTFWEYVDQNDNELEDALLDQLITNADKQSTDPQITNVRTKDYSIDMTVHYQNSTEACKKCRIDCVLWVYFHSLKKKLRVDEKSIDITFTRYDDKIETISITGPTKTPAPRLLANKRVSKRSSKNTTD